jgi:hypothetical protein
MAELSLGERTLLSRTSSDMMNLLLLDDTWTEFARRREPNDELGSMITQDMAQLVRRIGEAASFIGSLPDRMGDDLQARFDALMWGDGLSTADRDDLRWLVNRAGGVTALARATAETLSNSDAEVQALLEQLARVRSGGTIEGDLSRKFRCGLGSGLLIGGAASLPAAATAGAAAAVATGGAIAAGVIVGATGGVAAIGLIVVGLLVMRRQKC